MGYTPLHIIVDELNQYLKSFPVETTPGKGPAASTPIVVLDNIAKADPGSDGQGKLPEAVILSVVNVAEEGALKNKFPRPPDRPVYEEQYPTVYINLYLLFTAHFSDYPLALHYLLKVMEFFQGKRIFTTENILRSSSTHALLEENNPATRLEIDLHTLSFEQLNDLWGSLGGKQMPFVLYRARLLPIRMQRPTDHSGMITEMELEMVE